MLHAIGRKRCRRDIQTAIHYRGAAYPRGANGCPLVGTASPLPPSLRVRPLPLAIGGAGHKLDAITLPSIVIFLSNRLPVLSILSTATNRSSLSLLVACAVSNAMSNAVGSLDAFSFRLGR